MGLGRLPGKSNPYEFMTKDESAATDSSDFSPTVPGLPGGSNAVVADYELHCAGQGGIDLAMGFRLFLANKDVQAARLFREAVFAIKSELFLYESFLDRRALEIT